MENEKKTIFKTLSVPMEVERFNDLELIKKYYSEMNGIQFSQAQTLKKLLFEKANELRNQLEK